MSWKGFKDTRTTIEIDLKKSIEELWNSLDKDARWGVKKAEKSGLKTEAREDEESWKRFYEIYKETCKAGGITSEDFETIKNGKLIVCLLDNRIIAGVVIKPKNGRVVLFLNASDKEFLTYQPNNLLYWEMIKFGKNSKFEIFDLGGYQPNTKEGDKLHYVNKFKNRWGGEIKEQIIYNKNPFYVLGRKAVRKYRFFWWLNKKLKGRK
jgi:lipid II:glycine glycyltransferase (peptidoglycan interpeptide bridge formation enzyme)